MTAEELQNKIAQTAAKAQEISERQGKDRQEMTKLNNTLLQLFNAVTELRNKENQ